jgi:lipoate-protein ligase A
MLCRMLAYLSADGPTNMALDTALLEAVAEDPTFAFFRTYHWSEPTLSLGYFQEMARAEADPRWCRAPIVRRPTGGGAIWHHHELTYALIVPVNYPLARPHTALYHGVHSAIATLLCRHEVSVIRRGSESRPPSKPAGRPFLCFHDRDPEDLIVAATGSKIVGSAQRRRSRAILQHGSLLLGCSPQTPELLGVGDLSSTSSDPRYWSGVLERELPEALGLVASLEDVSLTLRKRTAALEQQVYRNPAWNRRR